MPQPQKDPAKLLRDARRNRRAWDADSDEYQQEHAKTISGRKAMAWGLWRIAEDKLQVLGAVEGKRILELGCGAAQWSIALAGEGAHSVGMDNSSRQLLHAAKAAEKGGRGVPLLQAAAEFLPFLEASFDIVFCDYGAMSFADPALTVPEAARVLQPGGLLAFMTTTPLLLMCWPDEEEEVTTTLHSPYFGMRRAEWAADETVDFQLPYGDWIRLFRDNNFVVEDLIEIQPPKNARTTYPGRPLSWARQWPAEMIWKVRKEG
ncbi:MAG TPA: class I SAM-dependent methyltransferase [Actinomycetota bacterium]|nr:class I SAM-dependent methyltransferase [Actinomycetota bacterium]